MMWNYDGGSCPFCGSGGGWGAGGLFMLFFGLLVLAGIILIIIWAVRQAGSHSGTRDTYVSEARHREEPQRGAGHDLTPEDSAVAAARHRYASGEIDREELERVLATLRDAR